MNEKRKPSYDLERFKRAFSKVEGLNITQVARNSLTALGFSLGGVVDVLQTMQRKHFYKSMTSYRDHRIWQDVYHVPTEIGVIYVKFTENTVTEFILLSFKEK